MYVKLLQRLHTEGKLTNQVELSQDADSPIGDLLNERWVDVFVCEAQDPSFVVCVTTTSEGSKRKGRCWVRDAGVEGKEWTYLG
ncbi:hypothetical protein L6452_17325 [Arctium lappa]|uniref:Uncharacterized protein n=1 Tax=Arctium lappa TaxID=4217 RepID=A0ACB9C326_ARCLA|nr:hypothetical protein L6452_17325 [Arctium lappa]